MHRSGTSFLTGTLAAAGVHLGPASQWNEHNRLGNQELDAVVALNDEVLAANGGAWDRPVAPVRWSEAQLATARGVADTLDRCRPWAFKDPRTVLTWSGWAAAVPGLRAVGVFRHPDAVNDSLQRRAEYGGLPMTRRHCYDLWRAYNTALLAILRERPGPLICFDAPPDELHDAVLRLLSWLGLPPPERAFWSDALRHEVPSGEVPAPLQPLWQELREFADGW